MSVQARSRRASRRAFICGVLSLGKDAAIPCETGLAAKRSPTRYKLHNEWRGTLECTHAARARPLSVPADAGLQCQDVSRRGAGAVERARLESECTVIPYRGFESLPLRHQRKTPPRAGFFVDRGAGTTDENPRVRTERRRRVASSRDRPAGRRARRASDRRSRSNPSLSAIHEKAPPRGVFFLDRRVGIMDENPGSNRAARTRRELTRLAGRPASPKGKRPQVAQ